MKARAALVAGAAVILSGCWAPPSAEVRPGGEPGVIEGGIGVERVVDSARVVSVDRAARTLALSIPGMPVRGYKVGQRVPDWDAVRVGDQISAIMDEILSVYVAPATGSRGSNTGLRSPSPDARVLVVDPSYRVLTVQYPNGETEAFKIGLHTPMQGIQAGDSVAIRPVEVIELRVRRH